MSCCGHPTVDWEEATLLVAPPDWWPVELPWVEDTRTNTFRHTLCLWCGRHTEELIDEQ